MSISENIAVVREKIAEAAEKSGRSPKEIVMVAAAKNNSAERVIEAIDCGVDAIGENRVQEMLEKMEKRAYYNIPLHFIGHLQTNKARKIAGKCSLIQSVDSCELIKIISKRTAELGIVQDILIEINIGGEAAKSGVSPQNLTQILEFAEEHRGVFIQGLMAVPPYSSEKSVQRDYFDAMYKLFVDMGEKKYDNSSMRFLSMGMSDSFADAIAAGANMVRVGTAIFGSRNT